MDVQNVGAAAALPGRRRTLDVVVVCELMVRAHMLVLSVRSSIVCTPGFAFTHDNS